MTDAAFHATFHDLKFIRTRKVVQVVLEAPLEHAPHIIEVLGTPNPAEEHWVAVARLVGFDRDKPDKKEPREKTEGERAKGHFEACCQDDEFMNWFWSPRVDKSNLVSPPANNREALKEFLAIESANEFLTDPNVVKHWNSLYESFKHKDTPQ